MRGTGAGVGAVGGGVPGDGAGPPMMLERMDAALLDDAVGACVCVCVCGCEGG